VSNPARLPPRKLAKESEAVSTGNPDRNPPLNAIVEQQRANHLDKNKRNQQINHALARSRHHGPATFQLTAFLKALIPLSGCVLDHSKTKAYATAGDQSYNR